MPGDTAIEAGEPVERDDEIVSEPAEDGPESPVAEESPFEPEVDPVPAKAPKRLVERVSRTPAVQPAEPAAIGAAVSEVEKIVDALKRAAEQMEEVLELVELAERQKLADEREIDSLRRALNRMHRPHEGGKHERH